MNANSHENKLANNQNQKYTGTCNDLENEVRDDPNTGEILEIYDQPTGRTNPDTKKYM